MTSADRYQIIMFPSDEPIIRIHPSLSQRLSVPELGNCMCVCGGRTARVLVQYDPSIEGNKVVLSTGVSERLHIRELVPALGSSIEQQKIILGPLIGILCNPVWDSKKGRFQDTKNLAGLEKLADAAKEQGAALYLFRMRDVEFTQSRIKGFVRRGGIWVQATLPMPDVIYDQVISRRLERSADYIQKRAKLSQLFGDRIFNDGFFDKWQVHEWLTEDPRMRAHVPNTMRYTDSQGAAVFIQKNQTTFLKPVHGSLGLGIVRVTRQIDGSVTYEIKRAKQGPMRGRAGTAMDVIRFFRKRLCSRPYLLQEGISLAKYVDRPFDIRIVQQRDRTGSWKRTKMFARIARPGDFTSNLSSGGEALPVSAVLSVVFPKEDQRRRCLRLIGRVARMTTEVIEKQSGKTFGELGIDIGVDQTGGVWVIEVNSKPWKSPSTEKGRQDLVDLAFSRPIQYAIRLAQQK